MIAIAICWLGGWQNPTGDPPKPVTPNADASEAERTEEKRVSLFVASDFPKDWRFFAAENDAKLDGTWIPKAGGDGADDVLICRGRPFGYLRTSMPYEDFEFGLEWKYLSDAANTGILVHTGPEDKIWPQAIQVQLHQPSAGSIFPVGGAKTANRVERKDLDLPIEVWHTCAIRSENGKLSATINGKLVGEVTGCDPSEGSISLQSEGSEIHFRRIWVRKLKSRDTETRPPQQ